jgi:hypothetical protein
VLVWAASESHTIQQQPRRSNSQILRILIP